MSIEKEPAEDQPKRKVIKRELAKQRKVQVEQGGVILDQWPEPRLRLTDGENTVAPFDGLRGKKATVADRLVADDRHRVTGAKLAHTGATCGGCAHFKLKPRLPDYLRDPEVAALLEPGALGPTGANVMGTLVCSWAANITSSLGYPRTTAGEPACVHHESRADGVVIMPELRETACRSCQAPVVWAKTAKGAKMQLDIEPADNGNVELVRFEGMTPVIAIHGKDYEWPADVERYRSHFASCPDAPEWRKKR